MNINLKSIISKKLTKGEIKLICKLKDKQWKFGIKSQINWFKKNIKPNDIHNLFYIRSKLAGYTLLRKRTCYIGNKKISKYLLFDTLILEKKYRNKKLSVIMMTFNNKIIQNSGHLSFLMCKKRLIKFYKKNKWTKIGNKIFEVKDHLFLSNGMIFNQKKIKSGKYKFFVHK